MIDLAIIFLKSPKYRTKLRHATRQAGVERVVAPSELKECLLLLEAHDQALLLLDWVPPESAQVLEAAQGETPTSTRPILLISQELTHEISALSLEMNVTRLYHEPISMETLHEHLDAITNQKQKEGNIEIQAKIRESSLLQQMGQHREAISRLQSLHSSIPPHPAVLSSLVNAQIQVNLWDDAEQTARSLQSNFPEDPRGNYLLGRCLIHNGKGADGLESLKKADLLNPWNSKRLHDLGQALLKQGEFNEAHGAYKRALSIDSTNKVLINGEKEARHMAEEFNKTLGVLKRIPTGREKASVFNHAAIICISNCEYGRAYNLYQASLYCLAEEPIPKSKVLCNLGIGYIKGGELDKACKAFEESVSLDPTFATAKHNLNVVKKLLQQSKSGNIENIEQFEDNLNSLEDMEFDDEGFL
ncbi:MAG: tetratricopeptide repeat protein [Oligoflexales bacterium]